MKTKLLNKNKYVTLKDGRDFRIISKIMTSAGWEMNHATARVAYLEAMQEFLRILCDQVGNNITDEQIENLMKSKVFHENLSEVVYKAYHGPFNKGPCSDMVTTKE